MEQASEIDNGAEFHVDERGRVIATIGEQRIVLGDERAVFERWCALMASRDFGECS